MDWMPSLFRKKKTPDAPKPTADESAPAQTTDDRAVADNAGYESGDSKSHEGKWGINDITQDLPPDWNKRPPGEQTE
jgi:hypothetical protein